MLSTTNMSVYQLETTKSVFVDCFDQLSPREKPSYQIKFFVDATLNAKSVSISFVQICAFALHSPVSIIYLSNFQSQSFEWEIQ